MRSAAYMRIRRLPDGRGWLGFRARYEIEYARPDGTLARVITSAPGRDLGSLVGSRHPADLAILTEAADLAWDGGIGPWQGAPGDDEEDVPDTNTPVDVKAVRNRARKIVDARVRGSLAGALPFLAATLESLGEPAIAAQIGSIAEDLMDARTSEERAAIRRRLQTLYEGEHLDQLHPARGSLTEKTICRLLLDQVPALAHEYAP